MGERNDKGEKFVIEEVDCPTCEEPVFYGRKKRTIHPQKRQKAMQVATPEKKKARVGGGGRKKKFQKEKLGIMIGAFAKGCRFVETGVNGEGYKMQEPKTRGSVENDSPGERAALSAKTPMEAFTSKKKTNQKQKGETEGISSSKVAKKTIDGREEKEE